MRLNKGNLNIETSSTGARINTLQIGEKHFFYPQEFLKTESGRLVSRGGMHICTPIFGSPEGKGNFSKAPQHGELRDMGWEAETTENAVSYACFYGKWGSNLLYSVKYVLDENKLEVLTFIRNNHCIETTTVELGWHPYFNAAPYGGIIKFKGKKNTVIINPNCAYEAKVFPASEEISIELPRVGKVTMLLEEGFRNGYVCIWTDGLGKYFCVEPLLSYKEYSKGVEIGPNQDIATKFTMLFEPF